MSKSPREIISSRRLILQNPYAFIEQLEDLASEQVARASQRSLDSPIAQSRKLLENQYAHVEQIDGRDEDDQRFKPTDALIAEPAQSLTLQTPSETAIGFVSAEQIRRKVADLHRQMWRERAVLWDGNPPPSPVEMLDPFIALKMLGYATAIEAGLGKYETAGGMIEVAGLIDNVRRRVSISAQYPPGVQTFTAAHELGHAALHPGALAVHRDRPKDGLTASRDRREMQADRFAVEFLMPERLIRSSFADVFACAAFELNDLTAYALLGVPLDVARKRASTRRALSRLVAATNRYDGKHVVSLAELFHVSTETMAIRLEELGLVPVPRRS